MPDITEGWATAERLMREAELVTELGDAGAARERAAIVRLICSLADQHPEGGISDIVRAGLYTLAARIERGEHLTGGMDR